MEWKDPVVDVMWRFQPFSHKKHRIRGAKDPAGVQHYKKNIERGDPARERSKIVTVFNPEWGVEGTKDGYLKCVLGHGTNQPSFAGTFPNIMDQLLDLNRTNLCISIKGGHEWLAAQSECCCKFGRALQEFRDVSYRDDWVTRGWPRARDSGCLAAGETFSTSTKN
eukprot:989807-Pelagomonas_calceolata.AAC.3